ncbi:MAG: hypothetical protein RLZZ378_796 [Actinomycetota bacterium]
MLLYNCRYINCYVEMLGIYENKLECLWNSGFYSNVHQTFSAILTLLSHGISPDNISFEHGFKNYKLNPKQDIYPFFYKLNPDQELPIWKNLYRVSANETSNNVINTLPFFEYNQIINKYFLRSSLCGFKFDQMAITGAYARPNPWRKYEMAATSKAFGGLSKSWLDMGWFICF